MPGRRRRRRHPGGGARRRVRAGARHGVRAARRPGRHALRRPGRRRRSSSWPTPAGWSGCPAGRLAPLAASSTGARRGDPRPPWTPAAAGSSSASAAAPAPTAARACSSRLGARLLDADGHGPAARRRRAGARSTRVDCSGLHPGWPAPRWCWPATWTTRCSGPRRGRGLRAAEGRDAATASAARRRAGRRWARCSARRPGPPAAIARRAAGCGRGRRGRVRRPRRPGRTARPGIELLLELTGFHDQLAGADLVVTGEGSLDEQTLHGKAPAGVAAAARAPACPWSRSPGAACSTMPASQAPASVPPTR